jgi:hypothetical protein
MQYGDYWTWFTYMVMCNQYPCDKFPSCTSFHSYTNSPFNLRGRFYFMSTEVFSVTVSTFNAHVIFFPDQSQQIDRKLGVRILLYSIGIILNINSGKILGRLLQWVWNSM